MSLKQKEQLNFILYYNVFLLFSFKTRVNCIRKLVEVMLLKMFAILITFCLEKKKKKLMFTKQVASPLNCFILNKFV